MKFFALFAHLLAVNLALGFNLRGLRNVTLQQQLFKPAIQVNAAGTYSRISNGLPAGPKEFPHQVGLLKLYAGGRQSIAGGSLISVEWVLTAAHSTIDAQSIYLYFGKITLDIAQLRIHKPSPNVIEHPEFNSTTGHHDIALIKIRRIKVTDFISPIKLPPPHTGQLPSYDGLEADLAGWGITSNTATTHSQTLLYARFQIISLSDCATFVAERRLYKGKICTATPNGISGCKGDSGGALVLVHENFQIGILSLASRDCGSSRPNLYTRVDYYLDWINGHAHLDI